MLININPILSPELLFHLRSMGHGEKLILADANFPSNSTNDRVIRLDGVNIQNAVMTDVMTRECKTTTPGALAAEALKIMEDGKINALVVQSDGKTVGVINMHDLLRAGVI